MICLTNLADYLRRFLIITFGSIISAIGINSLIIPHKLLSGGITGIAIIVEYLTGFSTGITVFLLNLPVFLLGYKLIDRDFVVASLLGMFTLSFFLVITRDFADIFYVDDLLLAAIFGGAIGGLGLGLILRCRGSQGGTDILAVILKKYRSLNIGTFLFLSNVVIILIGSIFYGLKITLYTLISMYVFSAVLDKVQEGFDHKKTVLIVTNKHRLVADAIMEKLNRGATFLSGEGAFTNQEKKIVYCVVTTRQLAKLKFIVAEIDPHAFMTVTDTAEVLGEGFHYNRF